MKFLNQNVTRSLRKGALVFALGAFLLPACQDYNTEETLGTGEVGEGIEATEDTGIVADEGVGEGPFTVAQQIDQNVELEDLTGDIGAYIGRTVSVRSDVTNILAESGFLLQNEGWFGGQEVLVINATGQPVLLPEDIELQVTGEVSQFVLADVERDYGVDLDPELYADYEQQPVIIAESVALSPDPADVTEDPTRFYNQVIAVEGEIGEFVTPGIFRLEEEQLFSGEGLLVLSDIAEMTEAAVTSGEVEEDSQVVVTGVLRPYVRADFERDYDFWDGDALAEVEAEYDRQPVLVAREVYASAEE